MEVVSFQTVRRTREFGIRVALGASPRQAVGAALRGGLRLSAAGLGMGMGIAVAAVNAARSLLFGVAPADPGVLTAVGGILICVAVAACYVPARRAAQVDPAIALRNDS
jgi:ABC-type antimicrobial peptide transport system permease subunit